MNIPQHQLILSVILCKIDEISEEQKNGKTVENFKFLDYKFSFSFNLFFLNTTHVEINKTCKKID